MKLKIWRIYSIICQYEYLSYSKPRSHILVVIKLSINNIFNAIVDNIKNSRCRNVNCIHTYYVKLND